MEFSHSLALSSAVTDDFQSRWSLQQRDDMIAFVSLAFDEQEFDRQALAVGQGHDLGVAAATGSAHGLLGRASRRVGGTLMHDHMRAIDQSKLQDWLANRIRAKKALVLLDSVRLRPRFRLSILPGRYASRVSIGACASPLMNQFQPLPGVPL